MDIHTDEVDLADQIDVAELLAYRHPATSLWNDLLDTYDADYLEDLGSGWPAWQSDVDSDVDDDVDTIAVTGEESDPDDEDAEDARNAENEDAAAEEEQEATP